MLLCGGCKAQTFATAGPIDIVGTLALLVSGIGAPQGGRIELPDIDVVLRDLNSNQDVSKTKTQLDGKFYLTAPMAGTYSVCWDAPGIVGGCGAKFVVNASDIFLSFVVVRSEPGVIFGTVLTSDGRACWLIDPYFNLDVSTKVSLFAISREAIRSRIRANVEGEFAIGGVGAGSRYIVRAECEKATAERLVSVGGSIGGVIITLPNRAPAILAISAVAGGKL
ncbi:MAG: emp24/gp25L/p24 family protein [Gemmatimonadota bacterium]|nr:emp24/gp25L/p24 family protein [Gemmatimonadota bacterium]